MKVSELKRILEHVRDENEVMIAIKLPYSTVGVIPMVAVKSAQNGFDWENGKFILRAEEELSPADRDFAQQMRDMQEKLGWAEYEKRNLRAEIKKLNKKYGIES
jgi:hypothetical protein